MKIGMLSVVKSFITSFSICYHNVYKLQHFLLSQLKKIRRIRMFPLILAHFSACRFWAQYTSTRLLQNFLRIVYAPWVLAAPRMN